MEDIKVNITTENDEVVIRTGTAKPILAKIAEKIKGTIESPASFMAVRGCDPQFSRKTMSITYYENYCDSEAAVITGQTELNPDLTAFHINQEHMYQPKKLADFLKMNRIHFKNKDEQSDVVTKLNALTATVNKDVAQGQDNRGNVNVSIDRKVTTNIPVSFTLSMPIIVGGGAKDFLVEVGVDPRDAGISVWLESVELAELIKETSDSLIDIELRAFYDKDLVVIEC